jgi:hypothetical protein
MKKIRVTPSMAQDWIDHQGVNRKVVPVVVDRYTEAMIDGKWRCDENFPIRFNDTGRLVDGQHRLHAVVKFGKPVEFFVATVTLETLDLVHECRHRTMADRLVLQGHYDQTNAKLVAALGGALCDRRYGGRFYVAHKKQSLSGKSYRPDQIIDTIEWAGINAVEVVEEARALYRLQPSKFRLVTLTILGYLLAQNAPNTRELLHQFASDEHPNREVSITAVRRQLGNSNFSVSVKLAMLAKAINHPELKLIRIDNFVEDLIGGTLEGRNDGNLD